MWSLKCQKIDGFPIHAYGNHWQETGYLNDWRYDFTWSGRNHNNFPKENKFLVGMESYHYNRKEDRRFNLFFSSSPLWTLNECKTEKVNEFDGIMSVHLESDQVIAGVESTWHVPRSIFHSKKYDREWKLTICKLERLCTVIKDIIYARDKNGKVTAEVFEEKQVTAAQGVIDQRGANSKGSLTLRISSSMQSSLSDSFEFFSDSAREKELSYTPTVGLNWVQGGAGFANSFGGTKGWFRKSEKSYTEKNGKSISFTAFCPAYTLCHTKVTVLQTKKRIPYTIKRESFDGSSCPDEKGILYTSTSFTGRMVTTTEQSNAEIGLFRDDLPPQTIEQDTHFRGSTNLETGVSCNDNQIDGNQYCLCGKGERLIQGRKS